MHPWEKTGKQWCSFIPQKPKAKTVSADVTSTPVLLSESDSMVQEDSEDPDKDKAEKAAEEFETMKEIIGEEDPAERAEEVATASSMPTMVKKYH